MLRKVKLYGKLAEFVGHKEFEVKVSSVAQAVSFLIHNFPDLEEHMSPQYYQVKVGNYDIDKDEVGYPIGQEDIHFIPVISGAGRGFGRFILGAVLLGFAISSGGGFGAIGTDAFSLGVYGTFAANLGMGLMIQGVSQMLFPDEKPKFDEGDPQLSFNFGGIQNTSRAGTPVPIVYGEIFTGSVVISAAVDTNQVDA
tara:strand:+ start:294 stop:884 length:591 start_codon:yes stop_codon:yes gene_type:complete